MRCVRALLSASHVESARSLGCRSHHRSGRGRRRRRRSPIQFCTKPHNARGPGLDRRRRAGLMMVLVLSARVSAHSLTRTHARMHTCPDGRILNDFICPLKIRHTYRVAPLDARIWCVCVCVVCCVQINMFARYVFVRVRALARACVRR